VPDHSEVLNGADPCDISRRWIITENLARRLVRAADNFAPVAPDILSVSIISGGRTPAAQDKLRREGRPTAPNHLSTHVLSDGVVPRNGPPNCPATGADVRIGVWPTTTIKWRWLLAARQAGLRTGGGSSPDPDTGLPSDWNHVDTGPR